MEDINKEMKVKVGYGVTINTGNYENIKVDYSVEFTTKISNIDSESKYWLEWIKNKISLER